MPKFNPIALYDLSNWSPGAKSIIELAEANAKQRDTMPVCVTIDDVWRVVKELQAKHASKAKAKSA